MNQRTEILNELREISPLVASIDPANVFAVPEGYFATISDTVLVCLAEEGNLIYTNKRDESSVPENYFDTLPGSILSKIRSQIELTAADELKQLSPLLSGIGKAVPFELPEKYFDNLRPTLPATDLETPAALKGINTMQPFEVPGGYFEDLPAAVMNKLQQPVAKVVAMPKRNAWIKYAAAAVITAIFSLGIFKYTNNPVWNTGSSVAKLEPSIEEGKKMDDKKFDELLNDLSEDDIVQYLEKNGSESDLAVLTSSLEENALPNQEEYLLDNTTLDNFLQEIDNRNSEN